MSEEVPLVAKAPEAAQELRDEAASEPSAARTADDHGTLLKWTSLGLLVLQNSGEVRPDASHLLTSWPTPRRQAQVR